MTKFRADTDVENHAINATPNQTSRSWRSWFVENASQIAKGTLALMGLGLIGGMGYALRGWFIGSKSANSRNRVTVAETDTDLPINITRDANLGVLRYSVTDHDNMTDTQTALMSVPNTLPILTANQLTISQGMSVVLTTDNLNAYNFDDPTGTGLLRTLTGHTDYVLSVAFNPTGDKIVSGGYDKTIKIWNVTDGSCLRTLTGHTYYVSSVDFNPSGDMIASGSWDCTIKIWNVTDGSCLRTLTGQSYVYSVAFNPSGDMIVSGGYDKTIKIWNATDGSCLRTLTGHTGSVLNVAFNPAGDKIVSGSNDQTIKIWNATDGSCLRTLTGHTSYVLNVAFNPAGDRIVSGSYDQTIKIWSVTDGSYLQIWAYDVPFSAAFNPAGDKIISGSSSYNVKIWTAKLLFFAVSNVQYGSFQSKRINTFSLQEIKNRAISFVHDGSMNAPSYMVAISNGFDAPTAPVTAMITFRALPVLTANQLALSRGLTLILTANHLNAISPNYPPDDSGLLRTATGATYEISSVAFNPAGDRIVSGNRDNTIGIWNFADGTLLHTLTGHTSEVSSVAFNPAGDKIVSGSRDKTIKIWKFDYGYYLLRTLAEHTDAVLSVVFNSEGDQIVSGSSDNTIRIWSVTDGSLLQTMTGHIGGVNSVDFNSAGDRIVSGSSDRTVKIWNVIDGACLLTLRGHAGEVWSVIFNPAGDKVVSGSSDHTIKIWSIIDGACLQTLTGHIDAVSSVIFNLVGNMIVSGSHDKTIKIWDVADGSLLRTLIGHTRDINSVALNLAGDKIVSGSDDKTIKIWTTTMLSFSVDDMQHGHFERTEAKDVAITSFPLPDERRGLIRFVHDDSELAPSYMIAVTDGTYSTTSVRATIAFDQNRILTANILTIAQGETVVLTTSDLNALVPPKKNASSIQFTISDLYYGCFERISAAGIPITSFALQEVRNNQTYFVHDGSSDAPSYKVAVGYDTATTIPVAATIIFTASDQNKNSDTMKIVGAVIGCVAASAAIAVGFFCYRKYRRRHAHHYNPHNEHAALLASAAAMHHAPSCHPVPGVVPSRCARECAEPALQPDLRAAVEQRRAPVETRASATFFSPARPSHRDLHDKELPAEYTCPITHEIMHDPVVDHEGHTFEREAITQWLATHPNCPINRTPLALGDLIPNRSLREAIERFCKEHPEYSHDQQRPK